MGYTEQYAAQEPSRADIDACTGPLLIEFAAPWCGISRAAQPLIEAALRPYADLVHLKIEDGRGRALGRSFTVKLWPTLILMRDGTEIGRVVRPENSDDVVALLATLSDPAQ